MFRGSAVPAENSTNSRQRLACHVKLPLAVHYQETHSGLSGNGRRAGDSPIDRCVSGRSIDRGCARRSGRLSGEAHARLATLKKVVSTQQRCMKPNVSWLGSPCRELNELTPATGVPRKTPARRVRAFRFAARSVLGEDHWAHFPQVLPDRPACASSRSQLD